MVAHTYNPSISEVEAGILRTQGHPQQHIKLEASLNSVSLCLERWLLLQRSWFDSQHPCGSSQLSRIVVPGSNTFPWAPDMQRYTCRQYIHTHKTNILKYEC